MSGWVMFHMGADVKILAVAAGSATAAIVAGLLLARSIARPLRELGAAAASIAAGDLSTQGVRRRGAASSRTLATAFNTMAASVEQLFDARRELVSWASHDLRTPLASLRALIEAAEDGLIEPAEYLPTLREQATTLTALVDDLFELAQIDAGALTLELRRTDLAEIVSATLRVLGPEAATRRVSLGATIGAGMTVVVAPEKIERVLANLIANALRHTPADGSVAVRVEQLADEVCVHVEDTGTGFAAGHVGQGVRALLAWRPRTQRRRRRPRPRDRARARRGARRPNLGREPASRRRVRLVQPADGRVARRALARRGSRRRAGLRNRSARRKWCVSVL